MLQMNRFYASNILCFTLFFFFFSTNSFGQYLETFSTPNRGVLAGTCAGTEASCTTNYTGVDWTITGDFSGMDANDFFSTDGSGRLNADGDADALNAPGLCFETPILDISAAAGGVSFSIDLDWVSWDVADIANVSYQLNGGTWVTLAPLAGTNGPGTVQFNTDANTGAGVASASGLTGSTLTLRVCLLNTNSFFDDLFIDNVSVPEAGVAVLPVDLISFDAARSKDNVVLNWSTATEINNEKFEIEHRSKSTSFRKIGEIRGENTTSDISNYSFSHVTPTQEDNYYRLKQVDFDGHFAYSKVVQVSIENKENQFGDFYPNPLGAGVTKLNYNASDNAEIAFEIYDLSQNYIDRQVLFATKGENELSLDLTRFAQGVYLVKVSNSLISEWKKLVIH